MAKQKITNEDFFRLCQGCLDRNFEVIYTKYRQIAISLFEWDNLPEGLTSELLERNYYEKGQQLWLERTLSSGTATIGTGKYIVLQPSGEYDLNLFYMPTKFSAYGLNYSVPPTGLDKAVWLRNNIDCTPTAYGVMYYCEKIANLENAIELAINAQKMPFAIRTQNRENILTLNNVFKQVVEGVPVIKMAKSLDKNDIEVLHFDAPYIIDKLQIQKENYIRELENFLGINNLPLEKNERLIAGEVSSNEVIISDTIAKQLEIRRQDAEKINKMFGLNISVRFRNEPKPQQGGQQSGQVHSDSQLPIEE